MDINTIYNIVNLVSNKHNRGYITSEEFNGTYVLSAETMFVATRLGLPEQYVVGKAAGQQGFPLNYKISDDLRPYLKRVEINVPNSDVLAPIPTDYLRIDNINSIYSYTETQRVRTLEECDATSTGTVWTKTRPVNVDIMLAGEFTDRIGHSYLDPTTEFPICSFYYDGIDVRPKNIGKIYMEYISSPVGAYWGYDEVAGDRVYNPSKSRQLQAPQDNYLLIASLILKMVGVNLSDEQVFGFAQDVIKNGA